MTEPSQVAPDDCAGKTQKSIETSNLTNLPAGAPLYYQLDVLENPMSATGLDVFDRTIHLTNVWLDEIMATLPRDRKLAWNVLGAVLRTIRDRVPLNVAVHLGAQLPLLVRGTYFEQWRPSATPGNWRSAEEFFALVSAQLASTKPVEAAEAASAVFRVLNHHIDPNQAEKVRHALPEEVRSLWPAQGVSSAA